MANVRFIETTKTAYDTIKSDDSAIDLSAIYFLTDTGQIYKGRTLMTDQEVVEGLNNKEDLAFKGTLEEWNELTTEEKNAYNTAFVSEDVGSGISITDNVESGNLNPVTSNAVANFLIEDVSSKITWNVTAERPVATLINKSIMIIQFVSSGRHSLDGSSWNLLGTIASDIRPTYNYRCPVLIMREGAIGDLEIGTGGTIRVFNGGTSTVDQALLGTAVYKIQN